MKDFQIRNGTGDKAEVILYDIIGHSFDHAREFLGQINGITAKAIDLRIHSPGGSIFNGHAIFNALQRHPARIVTHVDGLAASMASIIALAGDEVRISSNAMMMIHNPWTSAMGDEHDFAKEVALLATIKGNLVSIYKAKTGLSAKRLSEMMDAETWLTADECKKYGFADAVDASPRERTNLRSYNLKGFRNAPKTTNSSAENFHEARADLKSDFTRARELLAQCSALQCDQSDQFQNSHADELAAAALICGESSTPTLRLASTIKVGIVTGADATPGHTPTALVDDGTPARRLARTIRIAGEETAPE